MQKRRAQLLDFKVDKLTNSIEHILTGEVFETEIVRVGKEDVRLIEEGDWQFDWLLELYDDTREVYKLTTREDPAVIQGLISLAERRDHVFVYLLESAPINIGHEKRYAGVAGNLVAFGCRKSFECGYQGFVSFDAKSRLMAHYEKTLGAQRFSPQGMFIDAKAAYNLVRRYFPDFDR